MTINANQIVNINPGVLAAAGSALDLSGLMLTDNAYIPAGSVLPFATKDDVSAYFGATSEEAELAAIYFKGYTGRTRTPGALYFARYALDDAHAWLRSGSLKTMTLDELKALSGVLTMTIDGTAVTTSNLSFSTVTSFSQAAGMLATALAADVVFDTVKSAFIISSITKGATSTITFATGTLSAGLKLTQATGALLSQGMVKSNPAEAMSSIVTVTQNWAVFMTLFEPDTADKLAFSTWTSDSEYRYAYAGWDTDINATVAGSTTTWGYAVKNDQMDGVAPIYGDATIAAFLLGTIASINFGQLNGRITLAFRSQGGLTPSVTDTSIAVNLKANGYNYYGSLANAKQGWNFFYPGSISGVFQWIDAYVNQIWLNANLQGALIQLLMSAGSIPYVDEGYAMIAAACTDPINQAINFGAIRVGVTLSEEQTAEINAMMGDSAASTLTSKGYILQVIPAPADVQQARTTPEINLYYADGGSIQQLNVASVVVE